MLIHSQLLLKKRIKLGEVTGISSNLTLNFTNAINSSEQKTGMGNGYTPCLEFGKD